MSYDCGWTRWLIGVVLVGGLLGGCTHRTQSGAPESTEEDRGPRPTHVSWQAKFVMSEGGRPRAIIEAPQMQQYQAPDSAYSVWRSPKDTSQVKLYLFGTQGDSTATLRADSLVFQDQKGLLDAYTNVVVVTESNKRLATEHLTWRQADRKIRTKRFVRIRTPTEVVQGNGLVADEDLDTYQIGRFSATVTVDDEDDPETDEGGEGGGGGS